MSSRFVLSRGKLRTIICAACLLFTVSVFYQLNTIDNATLYEKPQPWTQKLKKRQICNSFQIRQKLCQDYMKHSIGGNLCHDLCATNTIRLEAVCKSPKDTTFIIFGKWKDKEIVLKKKKSSHSHKGTLDSELSFVYQGQEKFLEDYDNYRKAFMDHLYHHIISEVTFNTPSNVENPDEMLDLMYHPYSKRNLSHSEMHSLWLLVQQEEFIKLQLLQNRKHIPRVYGFCGIYYAVERVNTLETLLNVFKRPPPWPTRVHIAIELLKLVDELKDGLIGHISLCDVHPGNFGVTKGGRVVALDVDTAFSPPQMDMFMAQGNCSSNKDCTFFDCMSICDVTSRECTSTILTNNLHNICHNLLVSVWRDLPGILNIPRAYQSSYTELTRSLNECAMEMKSPWQPEKEKRLQETLYNLLRRTSQS